MPDKTTLRFVERSEPERYTLGVVYEPLTADAHNDWATTETIRKAAFDFARQLAGPQTVIDAVRRAVAEPGTSFGVDLELEKGLLGDNHERWDDDLGTIVESYVAPVDMTFPNGETVKQGTWLVGVIWSPEMFEKIVKGERVGLSFGAMCRAR
jgi:hypothetical protein